MPPPAGEIYPFNSHSGSTFCGEPVLVRAFSEERPDDGGRLAVPANDPEGLGLRKLLDHLDYPAWIEDELGLLLFYNDLRKEFDDLSAEFRLVIKGAFASESGQVLVRVQNSRRIWIELSASRHPLSAGASQRSHPGCSHLYVACAPGDEMRRDRQLIHLLLGHMLEPEIVADEMLAALTPQQRAIYRLLRKNFSYKEIAARLCLAHSTIRVQIAAMRKRLGDKRVPVLRR